MADKENSRVPPWAIANNKGQLGASIPSLETRNRLLTPLPAVASFGDCQQKSHASSALMEKAEKIK